MNLPTTERSILDWDEGDVHSWFSSLGFPQYEAQLREHGINGETMCLMDSDSLKGIGVSSIGQRLAILKATYLVKVAHNIPIGPDDYVPPSEASERLENTSIEGLYSKIKDQAQRIKKLEEDNRHLKNSLHTFIEEFRYFRNSFPRTNGDASPLQRRPSRNWARAQGSPDNAGESPHPSPHKLEHDIPPLSRASGTTQYESSSSASAQPERLRPPPVSVIDPNGEPSSTPTQRSKISGESGDLVKAFKVSLDDPTWKVLPAALKKYQIEDELWQNYAMFICYGPLDNRTERCLNFDEKPLLLFQKLKDAKKHPVFMLKHMREIQSPIAVAHQKHAARKAAATPTVSTPGHTRASSSQSRPRRPPRLEVQGIAVATPLASSLSLQPGWPEQSILSPAVESQSKSEEQDRPESSSTLLPSVHTSLGTPNLSAAAAAHLSGTTLATSTNDHGRTNSNELEQPWSAGLGNQEGPDGSNGVSYAVAIYPYMAEHSDEFDVMVGDTFIIISRSRGWWVVQRDPTGSGIVEDNPEKHSWVPAGCLLETKVPVASAIAEANAAKGETLSTSPPATPRSKTPILPLSIISTSYPGVALMDYKKQGEEEISLKKDDALRIFKRYNHWAYVVKEKGGDRGWVPAWFLGKTAISGSKDSNQKSNHNNSTMASFEVNQAQPSPSSNLFPSDQGDS